MRELDEIEIVIVEALGPVTNSPAKYAQICVNGQSIVDLVHAVELPQMIAEGRPPKNTKAGHYWPYCCPSLVRSLMGCDDCGDGKSELLPCICGDFGCWPISVKITVTDKTVTWCEFENYHRSGSGDFKNWSYESLGPFISNRVKFEKQLAKVA